MIIVGVITIRLSSIRLPRKALIQIEDKTFLEHLVDRVSLAKTINKLIIATTNNPLDKEIINLARKVHWNYFVGGEKNVLQRLLDVGKKYKASHLVRITADNIFTDPENIDRMVRNHIKNQSDYTVTSNLPLGITGEVIRIKALQKLYGVAGNDAEVQEHVTPYIRHHPKQFKLNILKAPANLNRPEYRLTADYPEDLIVILSIYKYFYHKIKTKKSHFKLLDVIKFLDTHPEITQINAYHANPHADFQRKLNR